MQPFTVHTGLVAAMDRSDVDTDQIIPKQFLKRIERTGYDDFLFFDWRFNDDGSVNSDFELNQDAAKGASVLVARRNFGCGSSREHAVWALENYGFRVVLASSFADIFYNNCFKNGVLPIPLTEETIAKIHDNVAANPGYQLTVNLETQKITDDQGLEIDFEVAESRRHNMLNGLDDIALTLRQEDKITAYEQKLGSA